MSWEAHGHAFSRQTGLRVQLFWWTCPDFLPHGAGEQNHKHDRGNQPTDDPSEVLSQ